jgi:uncharacterized protein (TIGR02588 family)
MAEWVSLGVALLLLGGVVSAVFILWSDPASAPARFTVDHGEVRQESGQFYLPFTITNEGDETGSQVTVVGSVIARGAPEFAATTFDFIPGHARVQGVLIFSHEPTAAQLRVISYQ